MSKKVYYSVEIKKLNELQIQGLSKIGFTNGDEFDTRYEEVGKSTTKCKKIYKCCGSYYMLYIDFGYDGGDRYKDTFVISGIEKRMTNYCYDRYEEYQIPNFKSGLQKFQKQLNEDIKKLIELGIIKEHYLY